MLVWSLCLNWTSVTGFTTKAIHNDPLAIIEPAHMVVYFSCHRLSLILSIIIACYFYLNDKGLICNFRHGKTGQTRLTRPVWPVTRFTRLKMTRFDPRPDWPDSNPTRPDPPVLPCLPMLSRLRLRYNFYKIFTYSSLLNMLCTPLYVVIFCLPPSFSLPTLNRSIPRLVSRKLEQELHQIWVSSQVFSGNW